MKPERITILDILRGVALVGILFANIPSIARLEIIDAADQRMYDLIGLLFEQRFFPIFSFLFGVGMAIFMGNARQRGGSPYWPMLRRLVILALFGLLHQQLQPGEALLIYAIFGLLLLPLERLPAKWLLLPMLVFLVLAGVTMVEQLVIPVMFCLGMALGKTEYFEQRGRYRRPTIIVWLISLLLIAPALWAQTTIVVPIYPSPLATLAGIIIATALTTSLLLLPRAEDVLAWLAPFGRMSLTNYILQTVLVLAVVALFDIRHTAATPLIWLGILLIQIPLSALWLRAFTYGPLEWLWRWGTYLRRPPLRRRPA